MKNFSERRTDFGHSEAIAPADKRYIIIDMPHGEKWRVELEPDEDATYELKQMLEKQAGEWGAFVNILLISYT